MIFRKTSKAQLWAMLCLLFSMLQFSVCGAEAFRLVPKTDAAFPSGKFVAVQGNAGSGGEKFLLENLSLLQPVEVTLLSNAPENDLNLQLSKFDWKKAERSGSTKGSGSRTFQIRAEGDLKILVSSPQGEKPYQLAVWVGDEIKPPMPPAFVGKENFKKVGAAGGFDLGNPVLWVIALLLAAILLVLLVFMFRGKKS